MSVRRDDTVLVIAGKERGKTGKVRQVLASDARVIVEGVNIVKRHMKRRGSQARQVGIIEKEAPLHISNVALLCPKCSHPTRVGHRSLADGTMTRYCKRCSEVIG